MKILRAADLVSATAGERTITGQFFGLAVGNGSEHDVFDVRTPRGTVRIQAPQVLAMPINGEVTISAVRLGGATLAELWAFECASEMLDHVQRAVWTAHKTIPAADLGESFALTTPITVPGGRKRVDITITETGGANGLSYQITRRIYSDSDTSRDYILEAEADLAASGVVALVVEGEQFDELLIQLKGGGAAAAAAVDVIASGDPV